LPGTVAVVWVALERLVAAVLVVAC
jgi:hypothetical protein